MPLANDDDDKREDPVVESPDNLNGRDSPEPGRFVIVGGGREVNNSSNGPGRTLRSLHPYTRPLTISDLDSCVALENAAFQNEEERCTPDKFAYRLTKCGELSLGIFCTVSPDSDFEAPTVEMGRAVETSRPKKDRSVLMAHIVSTKTRDSLATDDAMDYPRDWATGAVNDEKIGHHEDGRTICIHSLAVLPSLQKNGVGRTLMVAYMQQMNGAGIADRLALIAHDHLVPYYENLGFVNQGPSKAQFGGGGWVDMIYELKPLEARTAYG